MSPRKTGKSIEDSSGITSVSDLKKQIKFLNKALSDAIRQKDMIAEIAQDFIFIIDRNDKIVFLNEFAAIQLGRSKQELIGMSRAALFPPLIAERQGRWLDQVFNSGQPARIEDISLIGSKTLWLETSLVPIFDDEKKVRAVLGLSRDVSARKLAENQLLDYRIQLEQRVAARSLELKEANKALEKDISERKERERFLEIQRDLAIKLNLCLSIDEALNSVLDTVTKTGILDCGGIYLLDDEHQQAVLMTHRGLSDRFIKEVEIVTADNPRYALLMEGRPFIFDLKEKNTRILKEMSDEGILTFAVIPIKTAGQVLGCMNLASRKAIRIPDYLRSGLETIASHAGAIITRIRVMEALRISEASYRDVVENANDAIVVAQDEYLRFANSKSEKAFGWSLTELLSKPFINFIHPEDREMVLKQYRNRLSGSIVKSRYHFRVITSDGSIRWMMINAIPSKWKDRPATLTFLTDITDRLSSERILTWHQTAIKQSVEGIAVFSADQVAEYISPSWAAMHGQSENEMFGKPIADNHSPGQFQEQMLPFLQKVNELGSYTGTIEHIKKDGTAFHTLMTITALKDASGNLEAYVASASDITEWKKTASTLEQSEARLRAVFNSVHDIAFISLRNQSGQLIITDFSPGAEAIFRYSKDEILNSEFQVLFSEAHEELHSLLQNALSSGIGFNREIGMIRKDHVVFPAIVNVSPLQKSDPDASMLLVVFDLTEQNRIMEERRRLEKQMIQLQKINSLGIMAGGVAHDFNNLLTSITGNAELAMMKLPTKSPASENLDRIISVTRRASELTNQMLTFAGRSHSRIRKVIISKLVEETVSLLRASIPQNIVLKIDNPPDLAAIMADPSHLLQVIMNLIINSSEAIGQKPGTISIRTGIMDVRPDERFDNTFFSEMFTAGRCIFLEVTDSGSGMSEETLKHLFDPFFTTKFTGRGLGLATVLGIIKNHRGAIKVASNPGQGTTMTILFPMDQDQDTPEMFEPVGEKSIGNGQKILVVDDDDMVLQSVIMMLDSIGYQAVPANSGVTAIELLRDGDQKYDAIILDLIMPSLNGFETLIEMRKFAPDVPILIATGYCDLDMFKPEMELNIQGFISKPFYMNDLIKALEFLQR